MFVHGLSFGFSLARGIARRFPLRARPVAFGASLLSPFHFLGRLSLCFLREEVCLLSCASASEPCRPLACLCSLPSALALFPPSVRMSFTPELSHSLQRWGPAGLLSSWSIALPSPHPLEFCVSAFAFAVFCVFPRLPLLPIHVGADFVVLSRIFCLGPVLPIASASLIHMPRCRLFFRLCPVSSRAHPWRSLYSDFGCWGSPYRVI